MHHGQLNEFKSKIFPAFNLQRMLRAMFEKINLKERRKFDGK